MKVIDLIGKWAIRTKHATYAHGQIDRSFMEDPIKIINATDNHIVYERSEKWSRICPKSNNEYNILSYEYCDDDWIDYEELIHPCPVIKLLDEIESVQNKNEE